MDANTVRSMYRTQLARDVPDDFSDDGNVETQALEMAARQFGVTVGDRDEERGRDP